MRILVADDEQAICRAISSVLEHSGYTVDCVRNGEEALAYCRTGAYDGMILDIMMPGKDGLSVLRELRASGSTLPVLLLSARGELDDRVTGLEAGADDYLPKPFAMVELLARLRSLLRRSTDYISDTLRFGSLVLDRSRCELSSGNRSTRLNCKEYQVLECFMCCPGKLFSTETLMEKVWGWDCSADIHVVWTNITNLRKKLTQLESDVEIRSVRGLGYRLEARTC